MEEKVVRNTMELADIMLKNAADGKDSLAVLFYDDAAELVSDIVSLGEINPIQLDIAHPDLDGYSEEYYVDLKAMDDDDMCDLFVCPAKTSGDAGDYLLEMVDVAYIDGDAHSSIVKQIDASEIYQLGIFHCYHEDDEDCDIECDECPFADIADEDEEPGGNDNENEEPDDDDDEDNVCYQSLIDFIHDVIDEIRDYLNGREVFKTQDILDFISRRFGPYDEDSEWMRCNCYYFASILNERFPGGRIYYDVVVGHFVYEYGGVFYDYSGVIPYSENYIAWDEFDKYDRFQKERIIRDCIK